MVAEQQHRPGRAAAELDDQPAELAGIQRALPAAVRIDGVEHDAPDDAVVEGGVVGGALVGVAVGPTMASATWNVNSSWGP
jgi:hypothetical protein